MNIVKVKSEIEPWRDMSVLYVYKKPTRCHINKHLIVATNAYFTGRNNAEIKLNVEYCTQCKKFLMSYAKYESYRNTYKMLLGKLKMDGQTTSFSNDIILSDYSPLRLVGYSVSQNDAYTQKERQYILTKVLEKGIMSKGEVIRYLEYFIKMNGRKEINNIALMKWKEDLDFVLRYKNFGQTGNRIRQIKRY